MSYWIIWVTEWLMDDIAFIWEIDSIGKQSGLDSLHPATCQMVELCAGSGVYSGSSVSPSL